MTTHCKDVGYTESGKKVAEIKNIGSTANCTRSKSCQDRIKEVTAIPIDANAKATNNAAGKASNAHGEKINPVASITARKPAEYIPPRSNAQPISPSAMSTGPNGVASIAS